MIHFISLVYLSFAVSVVVSATATNDPSKMFKRAAKYFGFLVIGSIAVGWLMLLSS